MHLSEVSVSFDDIEATAMAVGGSEVDIASGTAISGVKLPTLNWQMKKLTPAER
jgi:vacuolar-type H+-ATPase subunit D/Vma8